MYFDEEHISTFHKSSSIVLDLSVLTSSFERSFSIMNTIKNKLCSNLKQESLNCLMFINLNGSSVPRSQLINDTLNQKLKDTVNVVRHNQYH